MLSEDIIEKEKKKIWLLILFDLGSLDEISNSIWAQERGWPRMCLLRVDILSFLRIMGSILSKEVNF